ncbi:glucosidase 2 subunit beta [Cornus florida]|uniref:glucosidase 2 subunit beta n=1 Tax=Cornus florida TaxID=4283 RepID=UPI00289EEFC7|nr:glucosidase 2 subunit beta [Cornus florida]
MKIQDIIFLAFVFCFASIDKSVSVPSKETLGIPPKDQNYYRTISGYIKCRDGSKKFTPAQLNDDFCDCPDGTDEPGTSACPNGRFYCQNAGHAPVEIYSSKVNDGICDCCDGSDEYDGKVKCPNTCWEAGKVARDKLKKKIATFQEGVTLRKQEVEKAKLAVAKDESELSKLKNEEKVLKGLVQQLKERKEQIEKAEEKERLQKEKEEKEKKEAAERKEKEEKGKEEADEANLDKTKSVGEADSQEGKLTERTNDDKIEQLEKSLSHQDVAQEDGNSVGETAHIDTSENELTPKNGVEQGNEDSGNQAAKKEEESPVAYETGVDTGIEEKDASENTESLSKEELGRLVASRWTGENTGQQTKEVGDVTSDNENHEETPKDAHDDGYESYESEAEDDSQRYDEDAEDPVEDFGDEGHRDSSSSDKSESDDEWDLSDISTRIPSWLGKIQQTVRNVLQAVNLFKTPVNISEAAQVRKEYDESSSKLSKIESRISSLTEKLKHDFGPEKEFYSFYNKCFESKQNKYVYKICPFKQASQVEGYSTTQLGSWEKFEDSYKVMQFSNGDKCWNGPDRSLKVKLRCGLNNELTDIDEPSRCEYVGLLSTPALCLEERLKELQVKLDLMSREQPQGHDEL